MAFPKKLLGAGEDVILHMRTHWKILVFPAVIFVVTIAAAFSLILISPDAPDMAWLRWVILGVAALAFLIFAFWPFLNWLASTDTLTTKRLISRSGVFTRNGRDLPLDRINSVSYERTMLDRMLGCGTLIVETAGKESTVIVDDVPRVEKVHLKMQELLLNIDIPEKGEEIQLEDEAAIEPAN